MSEEFYSFDNALKKLKLREEELRRLVSEGEIRAYRSGETMKLRKEDVEKLQTELSVPAEGEVVDLEGETEELIFSEEEPAEVVEETGMTTEKISEEDTLAIEEPEEAVELEEEPAPAPKRGRGARGGRRGGASREPAAPAGPPQVAEPAVEGTGTRFFLIASSVLLLLGAVALVNVANMEHAAPIEFFKSIGSMFGG